MVNFINYSLIIFMIIIIPSHFANANVDRISLTDCISKLPQNSDEDRFYIKQYIDACFVKEIWKMYSSFQFKELKDRPKYYKDNIQNFMTTITKLYKFLDVMKDRNIKGNLLAAFKILQGFNDNDDNATSDDYILFQNLLIEASRVEMFERRVGDIIYEYHHGSEQKVNEICDYLVNTVFTETNEVQQFQQHIRNNSTDCFDKNFNLVLNQYRMTSNITGFKKNWKNIESRDFLIEYYKNLLCIYKDFMETIKDIDSNSTNFLTNDNLMIYLKLIYKEFLFIHKHAEFLKFHIDLTSEPSLLNTKFYFDIAFRNYFTQFIKEYKDTDNNEKIKLYQTIFDAMSNNTSSYKQYIFLDTYYLNIEEPNIEELSCQPFNWIYIDNGTLKLETPNLTSVTENLNQLQKKINSLKHHQMILEYITLNIIHGPVF